MSQQSLLPPIPWYESPVQVNAVLGLLNQAISIVLRLLADYTNVELTSEMTDRLIADVTQLLAIGFGIAVIVLRIRSQVQPLARTAKHARKMRVETPPVLEEDPTERR